ncbi:MAG: protein-L-isoaspartate(D-aspartate) O-methyltransferase [Gammaproteobacteria bacterium]|nr:protein-L-isoaspartate(D-aspartate) O-methyltransferase [Gammaproteobacteria bacterium]
MLREIEADMRNCASATGRGTLSPRVIAAIESVPRHRFVPPGMQSSAYENRPLAIGLGQTISQPFIVALMTDMLDPGPEDVVLEIGTGSGYQAAVLARIVRQVYSVETLPELARTARDHLKRLGHRNVEVRVGDGHQGWAEHAPYDAIIVTAAAPEIPPALLDQLKPGGRMVIPVGLRHATQDLALITKGADGEIHRRSILPVAFVPLVESGSG